MRVAGNHEYCSDPAFVPVPFFSSEEPIGNWLEADANKPLTFRMTQGQGFPSNLTFVPYYELHKKRYTIYMNNLQSENYLIPQDGKCYRISWNKSGRFLTCSDGETISAQAKRSDLNKYRQVWKIQSSGTSSGSFRIVDALDESKGFDISNVGGLSQDVSIVYGDVSNFDADQRWTLHKNENGFYLISDKEQTYCMDVYTTQSNTVHVHGIEDGNPANERFVFEEVENPTSIIDQLQDAESSVLNVSDGVVYADNCVGRILRVYNVSGILLASFDIEDNDFSYDMNSYPEGVYILRLGGDVCRKMILEH